jgi:peptidoglycan/xylan/chitin deacetylase (PgdA/CDA1 family)/folate-dependent phosphoribosylglycinamide formyltransferase PurN
VRVVVFTENPDLGSTPWWRALAGTKGIRAILVVRRQRVTTARSALKSLRRNVRKHGLIFIPYRAMVLAHDLLRRLLPAGREAPRLSSQVPDPAISVEEITSRDIHSAEVIEQVRAWNADVGVSIGAPILKAPLFSLPRLGTINVHLGRVPDFRGAPPGFWELWFDASHVGATVHWIDDKLDTGAVLAEGIAPIYPHDTPARVEARARELCVLLFARALRGVVDGSAVATPQTGTGRTNRFPTLWQRIQLATRLWWRRTAPRLADPAYAIKVAAASAWLGVCCPILDLMRTLRGKHPVRIFTYHRVTDLCRDGMTVPATTFAAQIAYVKRHHDVVDLDRALEILDTNAPLRRPIAVITFDDGYRTVADAANPVLQSAGVPAATFVCTSLVGTPQRLAHDDGTVIAEWLDLMGWDDVKALARQGWHIGGHTATHQRLSKLDATALRREVMSPLEVLRTRLGGKQYSMAYPYGGRGDITPDGVASARDAGYSALFSDYGGENFTGAERFDLRRIDIGGDHEPLMWKAAARGLDLAKWRKRVFGEARA